MFRRLCQKRVLYSLKRQLFDVQCKESLERNQQSVSQRCRFYMNSSENRKPSLDFSDVVKPVRSTKKSKRDFLQKYPGAVESDREFGIKIQPFSINAPKYLGNFINDLGHTLKIPYVYEDGYSAAMCLEKICKSRDKGSVLENTMDEGITAAEWKEIFLALDQEIGYLDGLTTVSLISLSFKVQGFRKNLRDKLIQRFKSLLSKQLSVTTLCSWSDVMQENESMTLEYVNILELIWDTIKSKSGSIAAQDLLTVYQALPTRLNHLFKDFYKDFEKKLPNMKVYDLFMIGMEVEQKSERTNEFKQMVGWLQRNLHLIQSADLEAIITNFQSAEYVDGFLLNILSRHIRQLRKNGKTADKHFMELTLNYSTLSCFYDENILEIACDMFIESDKEYTYREMGILLKAIGTLNHTPRRSWEFFSKVEEYLHQEVFMMEPDIFLDLVAYLLYIDRPVFNMKEFIFSATFQGVVRDLKEEEPQKFRKCLKHLHLMGEAFKEVLFDPFPKLDLQDRDIYQRLTPFEYKEESIYSDVVTALREHIPDSQMGHFPRPTFEENYIEIQFDVNGELLPTVHPEWCKGRYRKALMILGDDDYCAKFGEAVSDHMLGSQQVNINVLKNQYVDLVTIHRTEVLNLKKKKQLNMFVKDFVERIPEELRQRQLNEQVHGRRENRKPAEFMDEDGEDHFETEKFETEKYFDDTEDFFDYEDDELNN